MPENKDIFLLGAKWNSETHLPSLCQSVLCIAEEWVVSFSCQRIFFMEKKYIKIPNYSIYILHAFFPTVFPWQLNPFAPYFLLSYFPSWAMLYCEANSLPCAMTVLLFTISLPRNPTLVSIFFPLALPTFDKLAVALGRDSVPATFLNLEQSLSSFWRATQENTSGEGSFPQETWNWKMMWERGSTESQIVTQSLKLTAGRGSPNSRRPH